MFFPEEVQEVAVGYHRGVELDLDGLGVISETAVSGADGGPAGVAHAGPHHPGHTPEPGVGSPESPQGEGGLFRVPGSLEIDGGEGDGCLR